MRTFDVLDKLNTAKSHSLTGCGSFVGFYTFYFHKLLCYEHMIKNGNKCQRANLIVNYSNLNVEVGPRFGTAEAQAGSHDEHTANSYITKNKDER